MSQPLCDRVAADLPPAVAAHWRDRIAQLEQCAILAEPVITDLESQLAEARARIAALEGNVAPVQKCENYESVKRWDRICSNLSDQIDSARRWGRPVAELQQQYEAANAEFWRAVGKPEPSTVEATL